MCRIGEYLAKVQEKKKKEKKGVIFSKTNTFLHTQYLRAYRTFAWTHTVHRRRSRTVCVTCKNKHTCALKCMFGYCFRHVHTCLPVESRCLSEVTDISVCLVCSRAIPQRPSRDISSQYLHEASETIAIYRPCFCWYSPGCQNHQRVHTNTGPLLQARKRIQRRRTTYSENGRGGEEVVGENWISPSLCLFLSAYHPLFFLWLFIFPWPLPPLNTQRHSEIILFSSSSTARETPSSRGACGKLPFKKRVFANNLWH